MLYEETQGITDFAAKVYMLAQVRAITTAQSDKEEVLTEDIIRSVARDSLQQAQPVLVALRRGDTQALAHLPDVQPVSVDDFIELARIAQEKRDKTTEQNGRNDEDDAPQATQEALPPNPNAGNGSASDDTSPHDASSESSSLSPPKRVRRRRPKKSEEVYPKGDLRGGLAKSGDSGTSPYESLRQAGYIASETEFVSVEKTS